MRTRSILLLLALCACGGPRYDYYYFENSNTGPARELTFGSASAWALPGATVVVPVSRARAGEYGCNYIYSWYSWVEPSMGASCSFIGPPQTLERLIEATCDAPGCSAVIDGTALRITSTQAGTVTVTVKAHLSDGNDVTDSTQASFFDGLLVECDQYWLCPGPHAILPGARMSWGATLTIGGTPALSIAPAAVGVEPVGVISVIAGGDHLSIHALAAGTATVTITVGPVVQTRQVRVAALDEVLEGELRNLAIVPSRPGTTAMDLSSDPLGEAATSSAPRGLVPAWRLRDGTFAIGAVGAVRTTTPGVKFIFEGHDNYEPMSFGLSGYTCGTPVNITGQLGTARLDWTHDC